MASRKTFFTDAFKKQINLRMGSYILTLFKMLMCFMKSTCLKYNIFNKTLRIFFFLKNQLHMTFVIKVNSLLRELFGAKVKLVVKQHVNPLLKLRYDRTLKSSR